MGLFGREKQKKDEERREIQKREVEKLLGSPVEREMIRDAAEIDMRFDEETGQILIHEGEEFLIKHYQKLLGKKPGQVAIYYKLHFLYGSKGEHRKSVEALKKATAIDPNYVISKLKEELAFDETQVDIHYNLARIYSLQDIFEEAAKEYERVIELRPDDSEAHNNLASIYERLNRPEKTEFYLKKALEINSDDPSAHYNMGIHYASKGMMTMCPCGTMKQAHLIAYHIIKARQLEPSIDTKIIHPSKLF